jgi:hypothetical protein
MMIKAVEDFFFNSFFILWRRYAGSPGGVDGLFCHGERDAA